MSHLAMNKPTKDHDFTCGDLATIAERELAAFFGAVTESFGREQAERSAEDWLQELMKSNDLPASTRQWRKLSVKVAARLASRVNASSMSTARRTLVYSD